MRFRSSRCLTCVDQPFACRPSEGVDRPRLLLFTRTSNGSNIIILFLLKNDAALPAGSAWIKNERFRLQGFSHFRDGSRCFYLEFLANGSNAPEAGPPCSEASPSHLRGTPAAAARASVEEGATLHPAPRTLNPEPCTLHPAPRSLIPESCTLHPAP